MKKDLKNLEFKIVPGTDKGYYYPAFRTKGTIEWIPVYGIYKRHEAIRIISRWRAEIKLDLSGLKRACQKAAADLTKAERKHADAVKALHAAEEFINRR